MLHDQMNADLLIRKLEALGRKSSALHKQGICDHGWLMAPNKGEAKCLHCGKVFPDANTAREEHARILGI